MQLFLVFWTLASIIEPFAVNGAPMNGSIKYEKRDTSFVWASIGDSWASGVSFDGKNTDYDEDKNGCHRWKESYGPLMEANNDWTDIPQEFHFAACSGARLEQMVEAPQGENNPQLELAGAHPQMITYHAGGNNCDFGAIVGDCIYPRPTISLDGVKYAPEFPDPNGICAQRIDAVNRFIDDQGPNSGLYFKEKETILEILDFPTVRDNKNFRLYVLGYAHFFNLADNYCGNMTFAPLAALGGNPPKVSVILRETFNNAIERVNARIKQAVKDSGDPRVRYIDVSPAFDKHRFCEDAHAQKNDQWYNKDVWLWNLNIPQNDPPADPAFMDQWLNGEANDWFIANPVEVLSGNNGAHWTERPFHPKRGGTEAIMNLVIKQAQQDQIPGVKRLPKPKAGSSCFKKKAGTKVIGTDCLLDLVLV